MRVAGAALGLALALSSVALPAPAMAGGFTEKSVTLVVWAGAGGALDTYGRNLAELLEEESAGASRSTIGRATAVRSVFRRL
jgi:tripartite-type tricarboxylate transporter receptor subunit TctC